MQPAVVTSPPLHGQGWNSALQTIKVFGGIKVPPPHASFEPPTVPLLVSGQLLLELVRSSLTTYSYSVDIFDLQWPTHTQKHSVSFHKLYFKIYDSIPHICFNSSDLVTFIDHGSKLTEDEWNLKKR